MKLRNKQTGEIVDFKMHKYAGVSDGGNSVYAPFNGSIDEWEDAPEEPKEYWAIGHDGAIFKLSEWENQKDHEEIGNYFDSEEEAKKAVEKLKAWKRLKDKGFKVDLWDYDGGNYQERIETGRILFRVKDYEENDKDLNLLFGGEE